MKTDKFNVIVIPFHDTKKWLREGYRTRDAHLAQHLSRNPNVDKVLVINRPVSLAEIVYRRSGWKTRGLERVESGENYCISKIDSSLYCLDTFLPDFFRVLFEKKNWWFSAFERQSIKKSIVDAVMKLRMNNVVVFLENPMATGVAQAVEHSLFVFDAIDNWKFHPQMASNRDRVNQNYEFLKQNADMIVTVSADLEKEFSSNGDVHWIPNAVDRSYFRSAINPNPEFNHVTVVYVGKIQDRVDFHLVEECVKSLPDVSFKFIGPVYSQKKAVELLDKKYANITFTGDIAYDKLPMALHDADVAIIPHRVDNFTNSMNPLKLYEYIAAGKPVVTTKVAGVHGVSKFVMMAENDQEFLRDLKTLVSQSSKNEINQSEVGESLNSSISWESRTDQLVGLIRERMQKKNYD